MFIARVDSEQFGTVMKTATREDTHIQFILAGLPLIARFPLTEVLLNIQLTHIDI
jgi:hypothetical protein